MLEQIACHAVYTPYGSAPCKMLPSSHYLICQLLYPTDVHGVLQRSSRLT